MNPNLMVLARTLPRVVAPTLVQTPLGLCLLRQTTRQVENQADKASDNGDVQGRNIFRRIVGTFDIDSLGSHLSQAPAVFGFLASAEPAT